MAHKLKEVIEGELVVSGHNEIHIELPAGCPDDLKVRFCDEPAPIPCNPMWADELAYDICREGRKFELFLKWRVQSTRKIIWTLFYM
jgi:hypothetical protein